MSSQLKPGTQVTLRDDPSRTGVLTGKFERIGEHEHYQVFFGGSRPLEFHPTYELVTEEEDSADVFSRLREERYGKPIDLRRTLTHIQLNGRLSDVVYSMDTTDTQFLPYQFKPVLSFLESPSRGLLIADEVGLGKTIEAGLIWTELRARFDTRRLLIVCPAMLQEKWKLELYSRFGVEADIVGPSELLKELEKGKFEIPPGRGLIASIQGIRPPRNSVTLEGGVGRSARQRLAEYLENKTDDEPIIDLTIIDEAHYCRNPETSSAYLGQLLRDVSDHLVLLSATPINLREDDLFHLLNLVDPESFTRLSDFPRVLEANEPLQQARLLCLDESTDASQILELLIQAQSFELLSNSQQLKGLVSSGITPEVLESRAGRVRIADQIERVNLLKHAVTRTRKVEVENNKVIRNPYTEFVELTAAEKEFYDGVTNAIRGFSAQREMFVGFLLAMPQRQVSSCMYAAAKAWNRRVLHRDSDVEISDEMVFEQFGAEVGDEDDAPLLNYLIKEILPSIDLNELRQNDSKYNRLQSILVNFLKENPTEKIVIFSFFRGTLDYLSKRLAEDGIRSQVLKGGMAINKQQVIDQFKSDDDISVLLSSEVASEGVDLQFCSVLVNYDLPWNPMKVEQRIGRLDRIGQSAEKIIIWNLCYQDTIDERIYTRLLHRLNIFEQALGGLDAILGEQITQLTNQLLSRRLTPKEEEVQIENTAKAIEHQRLTQQQLEENAAQLIAHGGYIMGRIKAAHTEKKTITKEDLFVYVNDYIQGESRGSKFEQLNSEQLLCDIQLEPGLAASLDHIVQRDKLFGKTRLNSGEKVRCLFSNKVYNLGSKYEVINQHHPLIRFISKEMDTDVAYIGLVAIRLEQRYTELQPGYYAFSGDLWKFSGLKDEEELQFRLVGIDDIASEVDSSVGLTTINAARLYGEQWLEVSNDLQGVDIEPGIKETIQILQNDYEIQRQQKMIENSDRVGFQIASLDRHFNRQITKLQETLDQHLLKNQTRMIAPTEGRIRKVTERVEVQRAKFRSQIDSFRPSKEDVVSGVLNVH